MSYDSLDIEVAKGPEVSVFQRYRDHFKKLSYSDLSDLQPLVIEEELQPAVQEVVELIQHTLQKKDFGYRGDYTTFMKLVLVALTGDTTGFHFSKPSALSKARWMGKSNYAIPMVLLKTKIANELGRDTVIMTKAQVPLLERFVKFICIVYVKWWIRCPLPAECGLSDLQLLEDIRSYPDKTISTAAEKALHLHLWYLTPEQTPRCLFSS